MMRGVVPLLLLTLSACAPTLAGAGPSGADPCPDRGVRWISRPASFDKLLVLGTIADPQGGAPARPPVPDASFEYPTYLWLKAAPHVYAYVQPRFETPTVFGPRLDEPEGVYRLSIEKAGNPRCAPFEAVVAAQARATAGHSVRPVPADQCIRYDYVGPLAIGAYDLVSVGYEDSRASRGPLHRFVFSLMRPSGEAVAEGITYRIDGRKGVCVTPRPNYPEETL